MKKIHFMESKKPSSQELGFLLFLYPKTGILKNYLDFKILKIPGFDLLRHGGPGIIRSETQTADKAVPLLLTEMSGYGKSVFLQGGTDFILVPNYSFYRGLLTLYGDFICKNPGGCVKFINCNAN